MKKSAVIKAGLVVIVLVAVVLWTLLNNYFRGNLSANLEAVVPVESKVVRETEPVPPVTVVESKVVSETSVVQVAVSSTAPVSSAREKIVDLINTKSKDESFANSQFCRAQYHEFMRIPNGGTLRAQLKANSSSFDQKCFKLSYLNGVDPSSCFSENPHASIVGDALCDVFLTYYKYMLTDYLNPVTGDLKSIPDEILHAKLRSQFVPRKDFDSQLMGRLAEELLRRYPDELKTILTYLQAKYLTPASDFSDTGRIYPLIAKAYKMAPQDKEVQQFVAYSTMMSDRGLFRLAELEFLKDNYYQYYFFAWFHWKHKTDFEKTKLHLTTGFNKSEKYKYVFEATLKRVTDKKTVFGQENVFNLNLEPMPGWDSL